MLKNLFEWFIKEVNRLFYVSASERGKSFGLDRHAIAVSWGT